MNTPDQRTSVAELRRMLFELKALKPDTCIRFRLMGELWQTSHYRVVLLTDKGVALSDEHRKLVVIPDLSTVMQFELDGVFQHYQPNFHYSVSSSPEASNPGHWESQ